MVGSSPLTRGKLVKSGHEGGRDGLIPAHAGKTERRARTALPGRAHPRSRGENYKRRGQPTGNPGSSPLTRGKPRRIASRLKRTGLIPAHAGKTHTPRPSSRASPAHPRSRGENVSCASLPPLEQGSSPLTRGKHLQPRDCITVHRLIPAHAGKTVGADPGVNAAGAHPRSRGENLGR